MSADKSLWGVIYIETTPTGSELPLIASACQRLARLNCQLALLTSNMDPFISWPVNLLAPRGVAADSLAAWLTLWQDTPAMGALFLDASCLSIDDTILAGLAAAHGQYKLLCQYRDQPFPAYYSRACLGAGLRLWRQGVGELGLLLKVLKAPQLPRVASSFLTHLVSEPSA